MKKKKPLLFRLIRKIVHGCYQKYTIEYHTAIKETGIYIANHAQIHGPLAAYYYFPAPKRIWVIGEMCNRKEAANYAMEDFWRLKSKWIKWFYKLISIILVAPLGSYLMNHADAIPVYKDARLKITMKETIDTLETKQNVVIFPEYRTEYNKFVNAFQVHFVDVAKRYTKKTNQDLWFYPVYVCVQYKKIIIGEPIKFDISRDINDERNRIVNYLQTEITKLGESLPNHTIIPYVNIKKKNRPQSKEN